jgi:hypothetical protein
MLRSLFISGNCSTCFGWYFHPSSGAHTIVSTAFGICHTVTAICRCRGRVATGLSMLWVAYATHSILRPYVNQRLQIQLELLMMSGVPSETCRAFNEWWNNKFYYKVASCWLFLLSHSFRILFSIWQLKFCTHTKTESIKLTCRSSCYYIQRHLSTEQETVRNSV